MYWKEWLQSLLSLVILLGMLEMLLPSGELAKFAKLVLGLALMLAILQPLAILLNQDVYGLDLAWVDGISSEPDVRHLAGRVQLVATTPFLESEGATLATELEQAIRSLEGITDVKVEVGDAGQRGSLIRVYLQPFNQEIARTVGGLVASILNLPQDQISVEHLPQ